MCTRDGRTQSARACKPALLHLALRTLGFRTLVFGSEDLGFRTSINGHQVSLSGPGFQDLDKRALGFTFRTWVSGPRKLSILRSSYLFPVTFLCVHRHFSPASSFLVTFLCIHRHFSLRPVITDVRADSATENASRWSVIGRAGSAAENPSETPSHPTDHGRTDLVNLYIKFRLLRACVCLSFTYLFIFCPNNISLSLSAHRRQTQAAPVFFTLLFLLFTAHREGVRLWGGDAG